MVSGLAPGNTVVTEIVGKSTSGNGDTGRRTKASVPIRASATITSAVATGRAMKGRERFTTAAVLERVQR